MVIAEQWYQSGTFWAAAGVVVTLLVGIGAAIVAFMSYSATKSKRLLNFALTVTTDFESYLPASGSDIQITKDGKRVDKPYLAEIWLKLNGRPDISAADWDGDRPMKMDVHVPIISIVEAKSLPAHYAVPETEVSGSIVAIKPGLIRRGQAITFTLLVDGHPRLSVDSHLINVKVSANTAISFPLPPIKTVFLYSLLVCGAIIISAFLALAGQGNLAAAILVMLLFFYTNYLWTVLRQHKKDQKEAQRQSSLS